MEIRPVLHPSNDSLEAHLKALYGTLENTSLENISFDMREIQWTPPLLIGPLAALINENPASRSFLLPQNLNTRSYLQTIAFPSGVNGDNASRMESNYLPICMLNQRDVLTRNLVQQSLQENLFRRCGIHSGAKSAFYMPLSEITTNLIEHSNTSKGYVVAQFYPKKQYLDVAIIDRGQGIAGSYKNELNIDLSHEDAILNAVQGLSSKPSQERGFGIQTSIKIVCGKIQGEIMIISGDAVGHLKSIDGTVRYNAIDLPNLLWDGVIVLLRIPQINYAIEISELT